MYAQRQSKTGSTEYTASWSTFSMLAEDFSFRVAVRNTYMYFKTYWLLLPQPSNVISAILLTFYNKRCYFEKWSDWVRTCHERCDVLGTVALWSGGALLIKQVLRTAVCVPGQVAISRVIRADGTHSRTDLTPATADRGSCPRRVVARHVLGNLVVRMLEVSRPPTSPVCLSTDEVLAESRGPRQDHDEVLHNQL
ncbi:hypothetical protein RRG08_037620 [Elysia crispata]|uniref:Uncharacterized protein n=1 Tax=Elysia crispata TaxID=231223 RepID=A0AAE0YHL9_9GAST|nr:hypothetical protein RRG08_037620 [Elysia crispata]